MKRSEHPLYIRHFGHLFDHHHPPKDIRHSSGRLNEVKALVHMLAPYKWMAVLAWGGSLVRALALLTIPLLTKVAIDSGITAGNTTTLLLTCLAMAVIIVIGMVAKMFRWNQGYQLADRATTSLQTQIFVHMQTLSVRQLNEISTGTLISRVMNDAPAIRTFIKSGIVTVLQNLVSFIGAFIMMLAMDVSLTVVVCLAVPVLYILTMIYRRVTSPWFRKGRGAMADLTEVTHRSFSIMPMVHSYGHEEDQMKEFYDVSTRNRNTWFRPMLYEAFYTPITVFVGSLVVGLVLIVGGLQAIDGSIQVGVIVAFVGLAATFLAGAAGIFGVTGIYQSGMAAVDECFHFLAIEPELDESATTIPVKSGPQTLELRDVSYFYDEKHRSGVFNISFKIDPGETVAVVGTGGSGLSTLGQLMTRLIDPASGEVLYGGDPIPEFNLEEFHRSVGLVTTDPFLFQGTVRDNFRLVDLVDDSEQIELLDLVGGAGFTSTLSEGLDTIIHPTGYNLSSGQVAVIATVRALLTRPEILIFDGSIDRLDLTVIADVLHAIRTKYPDMAIVVLTKREDLSAIASRTIRAHAGKIV